MGLYLLAFIAIKMSLVLCFNEKESKEMFCSKNYFDFIFWEKFDTTDKSVNFVRKTDETSAYVWTLTYDSHTQEFIHKLFNKTDWAIIDENPKFKVNLNRSQVIVLNNGNNSKTQAYWSEDTGHIITYIPNTEGMLYSGAVWINEYKTNKIYVFGGKRDDFKNQLVFEVTDLKSALNPKNQRVIEFFGCSELKSNKDTNWTFAVIVLIVIIGIVVIVLISLVFLYFKCKKNNLSDNTKSEATKVKAKTSEVHSDKPSTASQS